MTRTTKKYRSKWILTGIISWGICFGLTAFLLVFALTGRQDGEPLRELLGSAIYTFVLTNVPLVVLALIVKDRIKPVCWMVNVIMGEVIFGSWAIYLVFGLWLVDNYILGYLKQLYRDRFRINREIDVRE